MSIKPVTPETAESIEAVLNAFETAYMEQQAGTQYPLTLTTDQETRLIAAISPHLGTVPTPAKITEILSEVQELHQLDGRIFEFEGDEYEPHDPGYEYVLADREHDRKQFIRYLIHQQMK